MGGYGTGDRWFFTPGSACFRHARATRGCSGFPWVLEPSADEVGHGINGYLMVANAARLLGHGLIAEGSNMGRQARSPVRSPVGASALLVQMRILFQTITEISPQSSTQFLIIYTITS